MNRPSAKINITSFNNNINVLGGGIEGSGGSVGREGSGGCEEGRLAEEAGGVHRRPASCKGKKGTIHK